MGQLKLNLDKGRHGGRRRGSGRKRIHSKGVAHREREKVNLRTPLHINFKFRTNIKNKTTLRLLKRAIINSRSHGLRILHFSMQHNHIHLIVEAVSNEILTRGMRSLTVTFSKGLKLGKVQIERYHLHVLKTLRETRNAIQYVLFNSQKHGSKQIDEYSSLLQLSNVKDLIRAYVKTNKITISVGRLEVKWLDEPMSYLGRKWPTS